MSIVRENLLTRLNYVPYCGGERCYLSWPRTRFNGQQFQCECGWVSAFEPEFIERYRAAQDALARGVGVVRQQTESPETPMDSGERHG